MNGSVLVVGSYVQDFTWLCREFPAAGETVIGTFASGPGGKGSNQAVAAGRAGVPTVFVGGVGADPLAAAARKFYRDEGIRAHLIEKKGHATATAGILVNASAQNEIVVALGASAALQPRDVDPALIRRASIVVCQHEANLPLNTHVFAVARKAGVTTLLNPAPMRADFDPAILRLVDLLVPNESEFVALVNQLGVVTNGTFTENTLYALGSDELHRLCRMLRVPTVILTLGHRGCFVSTGAGYMAIPAHSGLKVVDTTGAGDAFVGGFAAGWVKGSGDVIGAAQFANAVAALSVTKFGTSPAMPTKAEIARFLKATKVRT